jgi:DNA-binding protein YbaB
VTAGIKGDEFDDLFARARQALDQVRAGVQPDQGGAEPEPVEAEAADGQVRVVMTPAGKLSRISVDPRLLREGIDEVCGQITVGVNAAIDEMRSRATLVGAIDPEALAETLREVQADSVRRMAAFGSVVDDVVNRLIQSGQRS